MNQSPNQPKMSDRASLLNALSDYQREQIEALQRVRSHIAALGAAGSARLRELISPYLAFRMVKRRAGLAPP
jgi:hypothetical protein